MKFAVSTHVRRYVALAALCLSGVVHAQSVDLSSIPEDQRKAILAQVEKAKPVEKAPVVDKALITTAKEWAGLGQAVGSGVVAAAKEVGVAANDFAGTDLGKITVGVLLWKYLGSQVVGIVFGTFVLIAGVLFGWSIVRRAVNEKETVEYAHVPYVWGLFSIKRVTRRDVTRMDDLKDSQIAQQVAGYVVMIASAIAGVVAIF